MEKPLEFIQGKLGKIVMADIRWAQPCVDVTKRQTYLVWILALPLTSCVTLNKSLSFSKSWVLHLWNGDNNTTYFIGLLGELNKLIFVTFLKCLPIIVY